MVVLKVMGTNNGALSRFVATYLCMILDGKL